MVFDQSFAAYSLSIEQKSLPDFAHLEILSRDLMIIIHWNSVYEAIGIQSHFLKAGFYPQLAKSYY